MVQITVHINEYRQEFWYAQEQAKQMHYEVEKKVRQTIADLSGTMPEVLPTPEKKH